MKLLQLAKNFVLAPLKQIRARYVPLMLIYAAYAASGITSVASTFYVKKFLTLDSEQLIMLGVYSTIPWTAKFIFGNLCDSVKIFKSQRKSYIIIGSILMIASYISLAAQAGDYQWLIIHADKNLIYVISCIALSTAFCIQNVVSETMSTEVVVRHDENNNLIPKEIVDKEIVLVQYLCRLSFAVSSFVVAGLAGYLAAIFSYSTVFLMGLVVPTISLLGISLVHLDNVSEHKVNWRILGSGLLFALFCILLGSSSFMFRQEVIFIVSMVIVASLLYLICRDLDTSTKKTILLSMIVIFVFQGMPSSGPGTGWWQQDVLKFDEVFYGTLNQLSAAISMIGMWSLAHWIKNKQVSYILLFLSVLGLVLSLPVIGIAYGLADWTQTHWGFGAKTITLVDVAVGSPFELITTVSLLALVASHAPKGKAGIFFALCTSMMNLSLNFSGICTKYLYKIYPIERGHYENVGSVLVSTTAIGFIIPVVVIMLFMNPWKKDTEVVLIN